MKDQTSMQRTGNNEDILYNDQYGDNQALGVVKCKHHFESMGYIKFPDWVKCTKCGYTKKKGGK